MSKSTKTDSPIANKQLKALVDEQLIVDYLQANPEFFNKHPELLMSLRLSHKEKGAISLVERKQALLNAKVSQLEEEITQLMGIAANNERIFRFNCKLSIELLNCEDFNQLREILTTHLQQEYGYSHVRLLKINDFDSQMSTIWLKRLQFGYYFGRLTHNESHSLFGNNVGSVALVKLFNPKQRLIFAIASQEDTYFHPEMDSMLLEQLKLLLEHQMCQF